MCHENLKIDSNLNINNADYIAFVDASGDDGFKFDGKQSSSICYAVSMFVVKKCDIEYNLDILNQIKQMVGCKPQNEVKYTKIRRHKRSNEIHALVGKFKGNIVSWVAFKKDLIEDELFSDVKNKTLGQFCHVFPIKSLPVVLDSTKNSSVFIAVDVMKKIEMEGVSDLLKDSNEFGINTNGDQAIGSYNLKFKDSKSHDCTLIQAADIFAGIIRSSFEDIYINSRHMPKCKLCLDISVKHKKIKKLCNKKTFRVVNRSLGNLRYINHLFHRNDEGKILFYGINCFPIHNICNLRFIECEYK